MRPNQFRRGAGRKREAGQAMIFLLLALGLFILGAMAFAIDLGNVWFTRQSAQVAADAACTAGAMDLLLDATNGTTTQGHFTAGQNVDCNATTPNTGTTDPAPCRYAALNGYSSNVSPTSTGQGNNVYLIATGAPPGVTAPPNNIAPNAFLQVQVKNNVQTFFAGLLSGNRTQTVRAFATCGVTQAAAPIPILVLDPNSPNATPNQSALNLQGNADIQIFGGPSRSIQVNSSASNGSCGSSNCSVNLPWGSAQIDLSHAGPLNNGADMGLSGAPSAPPSGFNGGTSGHWIAPASPIMDPFGQVCYPGQTTNCKTTINGYSAPSKPTLGPQVPADEGSTYWTGPAGSLTAPCTAIPCSVAYKDHGCPDTAANRTNGLCLLYTTGLYDSTTGFANGIQVSSAGHVTALFDPGLYYVAGYSSVAGKHIALRLANTGATARPGTGTGDGSGGVTFYFAGDATIDVHASSGTHSPLDDFNTLLGPVDSAGNQYPNVTTVNAASTNVTYTMGVKCTAASTVPNNLYNGGSGINIGSDAANSPATQNGANLLMGPCTGYYGDPLGVNEPAAIGEQRWFLFFQDRSGLGVQPNWGGSGQFLLAGTMYFHSCNSSGSGVSCTPPPVPATSSSYYQDILSLIGSAGSGTYVLGEIVADNLTLGGTSGIVMDLNPTTAFNILKAGLYQ